MSFQAPASDRHLTHSIDWKGDILGIAELMIGKHRHGPTGNIKVEFESMYTKFKDLQK